MSEAILALVEQEFQDLSDTLAERVQAAAGEMAVASPLTVIGIAPRGQPVHWIDRVAPPGRKFRRELGVNGGTAMRITQLFINQMVEHTHHYTDEQVVRTVLGTSVPKIRGPKEEWERVWPYRLGRTARLLPGRGYQTAGALAKRSHFGWCVEVGETADWCLTAMSPGGPWLIADIQDIMKYTFSSELHHLTTEP